MSANDLEVFRPEAMDLEEWRIRPPHAHSIQYAMEWGYRNLVQTDYLWETFRFAKYLRAVNVERGFSDH